MLKKRIIPKFLIKDGRLVKYVKFHDKMRLAGNPVATAKVYNSYGADEIIFLDIMASKEGTRTVVDIIRKVSEEVFMPLTAGGGVSTVEEINELLRAGADKVSINSAAVKNPKLITEAAKQFGSQCVVVSIDYREVAPGEFRVFTHGGTEVTEFSPVEWAMRAEDMGCGEILLSSIDRDGTMEGYDLEMIGKVSDRVSVPLIASSGAGSLIDCIDAFESGSSAISISSMFLFTDQSPIKVRSFLSSNGVDVRASSNSRN